MLVGDFMEFTLNENDSKFSIKRSSIHVFGNGFIITFLEDKTHTTFIKESYDEIKKIMESRKNIQTSRIGF